MVSEAVIWLLAAMATVESGNDPAAVGDHGQAIGVYQIHYRYWVDAGLDGQWADCRDPEYAQQVVMAYWQRHCPDALEQSDLEVLARIHNGGPMGYRKHRTIRYWRKINLLASELAGLSPPPPANRGQPALTRSG